MRSIAIDTESSMRALSPSEQRRLAEAHARYLPVIKEKKVYYLFREMYQDLEQRYLQNPAKIIRDHGQELLLPLKWNDFAKLFDDINASSKETDLAFKAYYQHKVHTAIRYLSKPNFWISSRASYVYVDRHTGCRWATFEEYKPFIVMLWLAVSDKEVPPIDGYTLESRIDHFIGELALIGRTHNWDRARLNEQDQVEEYDDLDADRPSCFPGVKRRLFQAVMGHPLFKRLKLDDVKQEVREFVRGHFIGCITGNKLRKELLGAFKAAVEMDDELDIRVLKLLDVGSEQQVAFIESLEKKYGEQFEDEFKDYVRKRFKQRSDSPKDSHACEFAGEVGLGDLLIRPIVSATLTRFLLFHQGQRAVLNENPVIPAKAGTHP